MVICVLGRQPEIGLAELESLYGSDAVRPAGEQCALVDADVDFERLGGSIKAAELLATIDDIARKAIFKKIAELLPDVLKTMPAEGKIKLGLSLYGFGISPYELSGEALRLKKIIRSSRSVRVVPNDTPALSSAQTFHNHLAGELGLEFVVVHNGDQTLIGRVTDVQDIDAYRIRDRERPKRDAFVGMLPPKLAQIIINLAVGELDLGSKTSDLRKSQKADSQISDLRSQICILDPFCGTGVVLQEALLMGYDVYGTDLSQKMIDYSRANLHWLLEGRKMKEEGRTRLETADATKCTWDFSGLRSQVSGLAIATETYLGQPLGGQQPTAEKLQEIIHDSNAIVRGFLKNIAQQLASGTRLCVAVPAWTTGGETYHLPAIAELEDLGFTRVVFNNAPNLLYRRDNQITGRELVVLLAH